MKIIIGIDPGNAAAGLAVYEDGVFWRSFTIEIWKRDGPTALSEVVKKLRGRARRRAWKETEIHVFYEVRPMGGRMNGYTATSIYGVVRASGMILRDLWNALHFRRTNMKAIYPAAWRKKVWPPKKGGRNGRLSKAEHKERALSFTETIADTLSEDEAEAICIAFAGTKLVT